MSPEESIQIIPAMAVALSVTAAFLIALRPLAFRIGLVDRPGGRKTHSGDVPIIGGAAMFFGAIAGLMLVTEPNHQTASLAVTSMLLVGIGLIDDRYHVPPMIRILIQFAAVITMVYGAGLSLGTIGNPFGLGEILLGPFTLVGTLMVAITTINAYNLVDGVDGLAGILGAIALIAVAIVGGPSALSTGIALTMLAAVVAFLLFNFPMMRNRKVRTFMGDAGSTFLGFTIVWVTMGICQGEAALISPVAALWFASIPVYDSLTCFVRRILRGRSPFAPGCDHFHHTLRRGGFGVRQKLAILGGLQAFYATIALAGHFLGTPDVVLFTAWSVLGIAQHKIVLSIAVRNRARLISMYRTGALSSQAIADRSAFR